MRIFTPTLRHAVIDWYATSFTREVIELRHKDSRITPGQRDRIITTEIRDLLQSPESSRYEWMAKLFELLDARDLDSDNPIPHLVVAAIAARFDNYKE
jgi:hypothetical protein